MTATKWRDRMTEVLGQIKDVVKSSSKFLVMSTGDYMWLRRWAYSGRVRKELFKPVHSVDDLNSGFFATLMIHGQELKVYLTRNIKGEPPMAFATKAEVDAVM